MNQFRTIEIDFEVSKCIEMERTDFSDSPNDVLRRRYGLGDASASKSVSPGLKIIFPGRPWAGKGATLPHGTQIRMEYNGKSHAGEIVDGAWVVEGKKYRSPSAAAGGTATTKGGKHPSLDGWIYWQAKLPGNDKWVSIGELRRKH